MNEVVSKIYIYCTDFTINLANTLSLSYEDVNALIFCVGFPMIAFFLVSLLFFQLFIKKIKNE
jgi:hypothetical protein